MKLKIPKKIQDYFSSFKHKFNTKSVSEYSSEVDVSIIGHLYWTIPENVLWLYATNNEEGYDGSQTQFGIKQDGTIVWGYFSHCSCYGYEDYNGEISYLKDENDIHTRKTYELENVDDRVVEIMKERLKEINKIGIKDTNTQKEGGGKA